MFCKTRRNNAINHVFCNHHIFVIFFKHLKNHTWLKEFSKILKKGYFMPKWGSVRVQLLCKKLYINRFPFCMSQTIKGQSLYYVSKWTGWVGQKKSQKMCWRDMGMVPNLAEVMNEWKMNDCKEGWTSFVNITTLNVVIRKELSQKDKILQ